MSAPRARKRVCARGASVGASGRPLNFTVRSRFTTWNLSEELEIPASLYACVSSAMTELHFSSVFARASRVRVRPAAASMKCGARANAG
jgi:hypothetical protein